MESAPSGGLRPEQLQRLTAQGVAWSAVASVLALPLSILVSAVLARKLGVEGYARYALLMFSVDLITSLADLGFTQATLRSVSGAYASGDVKRTTALLRAAVGWNLVRLPFLCVVVLFVARPDALGATFACIALLVNALSGGLVFSLHAQNRSAALGRATLLQSVAMSVATVVAALAGASASTVWAASYLGSSVIGLGWLAACSPELRGPALSPRLPTGLGREFWTYGFMALLSVSGATLVFSRSEVIILEAFGDQGALATFALAYGLSQRLTTPIDTILGPLITALSAVGEAHPTRLLAAFERSLRLSAFAVAALGAASLAAIVLAAPVLYGSALGPVGSAFAGLAVVSMLQSVAQPFSALAYARGRPQPLLVALGVAFFVDVVGSILLVWWLGLWGAVVGNALGGLTALTLTVIAVQGRSSIRRAGVRHWRLIAVVGCAVGASYVVGLGSSYVATPLIGHLAAGALGAVVAFAVGSLIFVLGSRSGGGMLGSADAAVLVDATPSRVRHVTQMVLRVGH